jgi:hypothetical protein
MSCDRVLLIPIRKHTWLLSGSEKERDSHEVEVSVDAPTRRGCSANSVITPSKNYATAKEGYNPPLAYGLGFP